MVAQHRDGRARGVVFCALAVSAGGCATEEPLGSLEVGSTSRSLGHIETRQRNPGEVLRGKSPSIRSTRVPNRSSVRVHSALRDRAKKSRRRRKRETAPWSAVCSMTAQHRADAAPDGVVGPEHDHPDDDAVDVTEKHGGARHVFDALGERMDLRPHVVDDPLDGGVE
jgi:hypothetical protein